ncbi:hypothetical protein P9166_06550 [Lactococcus lactis]|nr:hypothetical protein P9166_06550 [Lactococcus lactis]
MKKVLKLLKGKEIIFVSLLTLIVGGVGGFFIGKGQSNQSQQNNFQEQMQNRFGQMDVVQTLIAVRLRVVLTVSQVIQERHKKVVTKVELHQHKGPSGF